MHIKKYDFDYSRRFFMEKTAKGLGGAGVLASIWPMICESGDITKAYPEELWNIEAYTKGKVKVGDVINADNIDLVQDLVDPILYQEVKQDGREFFIQETDTDVTRMYPPFYLDATISNQGKAAFDSNGNVVVKDSGANWIGGHPFPIPNDGNEAIANLSLSWGRHDQSIFAIPTVSLNPEGETSYEYDFVWAEQQCAGLVNPNISPVRPYLPGHEDKTRPAVGVVHEAERREGHGVSERGGLTTSVSSRICSAICRRSSECAGSRRTSDSSHWLRA